MVNTKKSKKKSKNRSFKSDPGKKKSKRSKKKSRSFKSDPLKKSKRRK